jgi:hypothetical protein
MGDSVTGDDGGTGISFAPGAITENKVFKNNALICNEFCVRAARPGNVFDHNCYFHVPGKPPRKFQWEKQSFATLEAFRKATGQEPNGLYQDPGFTATPDLGRLDAAKVGEGRPSDFPLSQDTKTGDLRLGPGSPCIDRGAVIRGINDDFRGKAPDIGAFERE